ncbi:MAG: ROK family protein [Bacteroidales bacterium]|nr:ROK family protein [Bacteroidales bacterium]
MTHSYAIGIDIGGTNTDMGLVREDGTIIARSNIPTNAYTELVPYVHDIIGCISKLMKDNNVDKIDGIGIGAPNGNFYTGCVDNAPNLTIKGVLNFEEEMHKYMDVPVVLSNDANAAAYGEMVYGGAKGMNHFIMFTLGTGVGSGIVVDGKLVHGSTGGAGELGHNILIPEGRQCSCGRKGCLETYTSARGIVQTFCELRAANGPRDVKEGWIPDTVKDSDVTSKMIGDAANAGDPIAIATYEKTGYLLGIAIANSVTFSAPEAIFLMGGPTKVGEPLLKPLRESFEKHLLNIYEGSCNIRMSQLKANEVAILGAAALIKMKQ